MDWREKLFGKTLVKCDSPGTRDGRFENVPTSEALADCDEDGDGLVCAIYFSFANISDASDDFGVRLEEVYKIVYPRLKVVQVVLWAHVGTPEGLAEREAGFRLSLTGKPWYAVPFHDVDTKRRLTYKYNIAVGVPTLTICGKRPRAVREQLLADPRGEMFPWPAPRLRDVLRDIPLAPHQTLYDRLPQDSLRIFYFAAHWCPPCRSFAPALCAAVAALRHRARFASTQLILVSSDRSEQSFRRTIESISSARPLAVPWAAAEARGALPAALDVAGIPALVVTDAADTVLTADGRRHLAADPGALNFPWSPKPVTKLTEQALVKMARHPAIVLFIDEDDPEIDFAESVLTPAAESYYEECSIQYPGFCPYQNSSDDENFDFDYPTTKTSSRLKKKTFRHVMFFIGVDGTDSADMLREHIGLDDAVPLLTAIDFPRQRMVTMKYGDEITTDSVQNFVDTYLSGNADYKSIRPYSEKC